MTCWRFLIPDFVKPIYFAFLCPSQNFLDLAELLRGQRAKFQCTGIFIHLFDGAEAGDGNGFGAARPKPGQRALRQGASAAGQDFAHDVDFLRAYLDFSKFGFFNICETKSF
jgi:hypothetical protein